MLSSLRVWKILEITSIILTFSLSNSIISSERDFASSEFLIVFVSVLTGILLLS
jgi:hypothetical protein